MHKSQLTVLVPYFNAKKHIANAVNSIDRQTLPPSHVIFYDDGSTDGSHEVVQSLLHRTLVPRGILSSNIRSATNKGRGHARQMLISRAQTELVAWLDADDTWHPSKIQSQSLFLSSFGQHLEDLVVYGNYRIFNQKTGVSRKIKMPPTVDLSLLLGYGGGPRSLQLQTAMGHRTAFESTGFDTELNWSEDYDFAIRFLNSGGRLINSCTHPLYQVAQYNFSTPKNWQEIQRAHAYISTKHSPIISSFGISRLELDLYKELKYTVNSYAADNATDQIENLLIRARPYKDDARFKDLYQRCRSLLSDVVKREG